MNKSYRIVWSDARKAFIVASECAKAKGKRSSSRKGAVSAFAASLMMTTTFAMAGPAVLVLPTNGIVTAGSASIAVKGSNMTISQATQKAILNWSTFDIGRDASVQFVQPNSASIALNRVLSANPSEIYGSLKSNGTVFLVNPQGVVFGRGAQVNVGGLVASSLSISDADFLAGKYNFQNNGAAGRVSNAGNIEIAPGGIAALIGSQVSNSGVISAKLGSVALASGDKVTLGVDDMGLLAVGVSQSTLNALASNSGAIYADGGRIILTAKSANALLDTVVNNEGILQSQSIGMRNGQVWMLASDPLANTGATGAAANAGAVHNAAGGVASSGTIDVSSSAGASAGQVTLAGSTVDVSGAIQAGSTTSGGGKVLINSTQSAVVASGSVIDVASAAAGGSAVVWSAGDTVFHGTLNGQGAGAVGHGASVEISAEKSDTIDGAIHNGAQVAANAGTLLIDPATLEIGVTPGAGIVTQASLESTSGAIVLSADGQITVDVLANNNLNLANATSFSLTSNNTAGIRFLSGGSGPSGITTYSGAPITLTASGNGSLLNVGQLTTHGGAISLSGIAVQLGAGLDASTSGNHAANGGHVGVSVFGGGISGSGSSGIVAGSSVTLDATYGYIGSSTSFVATNTSTLNLLTGGNAYVTDATSLSSFSLVSNHLMGSPVGIAVSAPDLLLTGNDATGNGTLYDSSVKWVQYSASTNGAGSGPASFSITQDTNLLPWAINLPGSNVNLTSSNANILGGNTGGNAVALTANNLVLRSPFAIGGINVSGNIDSYINGGASDGRALAIRATTVDAQVLNSTGAIADDGIISLSQTGNLVGNASASYIRLNASGAIGSSGTPFSMTFDGSPDNDLAMYSNTNPDSTVTGSTYVSNVTAGGAVYVNASYNGDNAPIAFTNVTAGGAMGVNLTDSCEDCSSAYINNISATGAVNLAGFSINDFYVSNASSNTSINISTDENSYGTLEVDNATLNGADNVNRFITITSDNGSVVAANLSTDGNVGSAAATPLGTINISAANGSADSLYSGYGGVAGTLRAGAVNITASYGINFVSNVDTAALVDLNVTNSGDLTFNARSVDAVADHAGNSVHALQIGGAMDGASYGTINITNTNGGLQVGHITTPAYGGSIYLTATNGAIRAAAGGGVIDASQSGYGGYISLSSTGTNGGLGLTGGSALSTSANRMDLTTSGDMNITNEQYYLYQLDMHLNYAANAGANHYRFLSGPSTTPDVTNSVNFSASTPGTTAAGSNPNVLTIASTTFDGNGLGTVSLYADGDVAAALNGITNSAQTYLYANNIAIGTNSNTPGLTSTSGGFYAYANNNINVGTILADNSYLYLYGSYDGAPGSITVNNISSAQDPGQASQNTYVQLNTTAGSITAKSILTSGNGIDMYATGGDLSVGTITTDANNTINLYAYTGNLLGINSNNLLTAGNLNLSNQAGNIGTSLTALNVAISSSLNISNQPGSVGAGGGGSIYLSTRNDPTNLALDLSSNHANSTYTTSTYSITPNATYNPNGLTLQGTSNVNGITISNIGVTGTAPATQVSAIAIQADAPMVSINSGGNSTAPVSYGLTLGYSNNYGTNADNASPVVHLAGSTGKLVTLNIDNSYTANTITGTLNLSDFLIVSNSGSLPNPAVSVDFSLLSPLHNFTLNRSGNLDSLDSYVLTDGASTGQSFSAANSGTVFTMTAANTNTANHLNLTASIADESIEADTFALTANDSVNLTANQILGTASNQLTAGTVALSATGGYGSTVGVTGGQAINIAATDVALTSQGDINVNLNGGTLTDLNIDVSHPGGYNASNVYQSPFYLSTYTITGGVSLSAVDSGLDTTLGLTGASALNFSFSTDRNLIVSGITDTGGSVTLATNGNYSSGYSNGWYTPDYTAIGIEQSGSTGITADHVSLSATGYLGHVGTGGTALIVATPDLSVTSNGDINVADSATLTTLDLTLSHGRDHTNHYANNSYTITDGGDLALTMTDAINTTCLSCYNGYMALNNLTGTNLTDFSLTLADPWVMLGIGSYSGSDFSSGQINLGHAQSVVNLSSEGSIFFSPASATPNSLADSPGSSIASNKAAVVADTLNLTANGSIGASPWFYWGQQGDSLPLKVNNLSVSATGAVQVANIGNVNITNAEAGSSFFGWAVSSNGSASITMPDNGVLSSPNIELMTNYGSMGTSLHPLTTHTDTLTLVGGGDMFVSNQSQLSNLSITSAHNKTITDPTSSGLNTITIADNTSAGGTPMQLGITDTSLNDPNLNTSYGQSGYDPTLNEYQYQLDGLDVPDLTFAFTSDSGMALGSLLASEISLTSQTGDILAYQGGVDGVNGTTTAPDGITLTVSQGHSIGAVGTPVLLNSPDVTFNTGGNLVVKDSAIINSLTFNTYIVQSVNASAPVYTIDNSAATAGHRLTFDVTADPTYDTNTGILNINNIVMASGEDGDSLSVSTFGHMGVKGISVAADEGSVSLSSAYHNMISLASPTGIVADNVNLNVGPSGAGQTLGTSLAAIKVDTSNLTVSNNTSGGGDIYISFVGTPTKTLSSVSITENNVSSSNVLSIIDNAFFSLSGGSNGSGSFSLLSATGTSTDLSFVTYSDFHIGHLNLGSGNLALHSYSNSINADSGSSGSPNIVTTGDISLAAAVDVGNNSGTAIYTEVTGNVALAVYNNGNIFLNQVNDATPLNIDSLSTYVWGSGSVNLTSAGAMNLNGFSLGSGGLNITAGGDLNYSGNIYLNQAAVSMTSTTGSINAHGNGIYGSSGATLTAADNISIGAIGTTYLNGGYGNGPATDPISLTATAGNVDLTSGNLNSNTSVSITAGGYIRSEGGNFGLTPVVTLHAAGDIGYWNGESLSTWNLNDSNNHYYAGNYSFNPGTLTLDAVSTAGAVNLASYAGVNVTHLSGAHDVSLEVYGDYLVPTAGILIGADPSGTSAGTVASTAGSVTLITDNGDITGAAGNRIKAHDTITLLAREPLYQNNNGGSGSAAVNATAFNLGDSTHALVLNAPEINLTANGNIYATLPATGVTDISVGRTYVDVGSSSRWSSIGDLMPGGTVQIDQAGSPGTHIVAITDGGVNGSSALAVNYGSALNFTYNAINAIQLGSINLGSGDLTLGVSNPFDVSITSLGGSISGGQVTFTLNPEYNYASPSTVATGGFGTSGNAINTQVSSISGTTTGATAGFYVSQTGAITLHNLHTGGGIGVTSTGAITLEDAVGSDNAAVSLDAGSAAINVAGPGTSVFANDDLTLTGASINLAGSSAQSFNGDVALTANSGAMTLTNSEISSNNGSTTLIQGSGSLDLSTASVSGATTVDIVAAQDVTIGSIYAGTTVTLTATNGVIQGTTNSVGVTGATVALNAATGIGTVHSVLVTGGSGNTITATTTTGDVNLLAGQQSDQSSSATLNISTGGGAIDVVNNYGTLELASVVSNDNGADSLGNIVVTNQANNTAIQIDNVTAAGGGAMVAIKAPSGSIFDNYLGTGITASRIAINALGQGGSIYSGGSPVDTVNGVTVSGVQVNGQAVVAVASGDIALNSTNTDLSQMPLVASNGSGSTINIVSAGDFQVGQIVAGLNAGTVNINSAANIEDDGNASTQIQSGIVNLTATNHIGTSEDSIAIVAHDYTNHTGGVISATSVGTGNIYLNQTGDVTLQNLTTANGAITANVAGNTFVNLADSHATDASGNDVNITLSSGDMTVNQAFAGATLGLVNLTASAGSILGDANNSSYGSPANPNGSPTPRDCCTDPHISGSAANLVARNNIGDNGSDATQTLAVNTTSISTSTTANGASTVLLVSNPADQTADSTVALGGDAYSFTALGSNSSVNVQACNNLDLTGMGDGAAWLHTGAGSNVTLGAVQNLLLPTTLDTTTNTSLGSLTLIGGNDVYAPNNGSTQHTLNINTTNLLLKTGAAGSTGDVNTSDSLIVNAIGNAADVIVTGSTLTDLTINTDSHTIISAENNNGNIVIGMPGSGSLNIYAVRNTATNGTVTLNAPAGKIAQAAEDPLGQFSEAGISANGVIFNVLHDIGSAAAPLVLAVNNVGANIGSDGGIYLSIAPQSGTATLTGMTTSNGDINISSSGLLTVSGAIQAGTHGSGNVVLGAAGDINLNNAVSGTESVQITAGGNLIDGYGSASTPTVTASSINIASAGTIGGADDLTPLWVNTGTIVASSVGNMRITDVATSPLTLATVNSHNGAITIESSGTINLNKIDAGTGDVTITSDTGAIEDIITGHASLANPNITSTGTVTLNAATHVGSSDDSIWVAGTQAFSGGSTPNSPRQVWINYLPPVVPSPNPYPQMPTIPGVSNQTVFMAIAYQQIGEPLSLPFIMAGAVQRTSEPMKVDVSGFGINLPDNLGPFVEVQDQTFNTKPEPVEGGNETEYGRKQQSAISESS